MTQTFNRSRATFRRPNNNSNRFRANPRGFTKQKNSFNLNEIMNRPSPIINDSERPIKHLSFSDFKIAGPLLENILKKGYSTPTPIQDNAI